MCVLVCVYVKSGAPGLDSVGQILCGARWTFSLSLREAAKSPAMESVVSEHRHGNQLVLARLLLDEDCRDFFFFFFGAEASN